jgi:DnaJ domain
MNAALAAGRRLARACAAPRQLSTAERDAYRVMGLPRGATREQVRARYLQLSKLLHPDAQTGSGSSAAAFAELAHAYEHLCAIGHSASSEPAARPAGRTVYSWDHGGEMLMRLRRDFAGGRTKSAHASPTEWCLRSGSNGEPPCFVTCNGCKTARSKAEAGQHVGS